MKIPLNLIITTKTCFFDAEIHEIIINNKELFSVENRYSIYFLIFIISK